MRTTSLNILNLCVPCYNHCKYCLLSWDGKCVGIEHARGVEYARNFYIWIQNNHPEINFVYYFGYSMANGVVLHSDPYAQTAQTTIPFDQARLHKSEFCEDCRKLLAASKHNYVLVDAYDQENISVYDIVEGICCEMRCYTVSATISNDKTEVTK